jgi:hypothetical protein
MACLPARICAQEIARFDLTKPEQAAVWKPTHDIRAMKSTPAGLWIDISGDDPYSYGAGHDYPAGQPLWLRIRMKSDQGGTGQVFWWAPGSGPTEESSVKIPVKAGAWDEERVPIPPLGPYAFLRLDPPGTGGACTVAFIAIEKRTLLPEPTWPKPAAPKIEAGAPAVVSGPVEVAQSRKAFGAVRVRVAGVTMATGLTCGRIGELRNGRVVWTSLAGAQARVRAAGDTIRAVCSVRDGDGGRWLIEQTFRALPGKSAVEVTSTMRADRDRSVVYLPMFALLPGLGSYGADRNQALLSGVEYMDRQDVSSSRADLELPSAQRQVPDTAKLTLPLMALQARGRYVGIAWRPSRRFAALFDVPDRTFHSGASLMGLIFPGSNGIDRDFGRLLPYEAVSVRAGQPVTVRCIILGGSGSSVAPAVKHAVALSGLPPLPSSDWSLARYAKFAATGWLDSGVRVGDRYRHTAMRTVPPQIAPDAAALMLWLAGRTTDAGLAQRLKDQVTAVVAATPPQELNFAGMTHVHTAVEALLFGHVEENAARMEGAARDELGRFEADGTVTYHPGPGRPDFSRTHFEKHANGLAGPVVSDLLDKATWSGDPGLIAEAVRHLRDLVRYANTVPRGAQTWEVPLHTPDILASAHLVRCYTMGYQITGDRHLLDQAIYWAWTGVPFVYLNNPVGLPIGTYATTPVLGATWWVAPDWIGLPVQWCGLVYADALYRLLPFDPHGPWKRIADGIAVSGMQQSWPLGSDPQRQGLLPDSFVLRGQIRNDPAINPGTVEVPATFLYGGPQFYGFCALRKSHLYVHAPGDVANPVETQGRVEFTVRPWPHQPVYVLVSGLRGNPAVRAISGNLVGTSYNESSGRLVLTVDGGCRISIRLAASK